MVTVVHNHEIQDLIQPWPSPVEVVDTYIVPEIGIVSDSTNCGHTDAGRLLVAVASGSEDEPLSVLLKVAETIGVNTTLVITGNKDSLMRTLSGRRLPDNVKLPGFVPRAEYLALLRQAHAVMCLTTRPATMQLGAWEAASLGRPIVVSDHAVLRDYFGANAVYVNHSADAIIEGLQILERDYDGFLGRMVMLAKQMKERRSSAIHRVSMCLTLYGQVCVTGSP
jgi:glycosyltransferase involved in cell wall biosynthesis